MKASKSSQKLQQLFSFENLKAGQLISPQVMERDKGVCSSSTPCNYDPDSSRHLGPCDICRDDSFPWYNYETGLCYTNPVRNKEKVASGWDKCANPRAAPARTCECHKALCWYFT